MEQTAPSQANSLFATEPVGKLILKFSIPCVISLLVSSLYNIVDQIFIGWGVGYLGNGATNVVFPITIIALALALMIGDGCASFLSLRLGEGNREQAQRGVGNAIVMVVVVSLVLTAVFLLWIDPILTLFGATDALRDYALAYGRIIGLSLPFMMIPAALNAMIRADGSPKYAIVSMLLGAVVNTALDPVFIFCFGMGVEGAAIYLQAIGKPVKSALLSLSRQILFFVPVILILTYLLGVTGVLWTGPIADGLAFLLALFMILYERKQLHLASAALAATPAREGGQG